MSCDEIRGISQLLFSIFIIYIYIDTGDARSCAWLGARVDIITGVGCFGARCESARLRQRGALLNVGVPATR